MKTSRDSKNQVLPIKATLTHILVSQGKEALSGPDDQLSVSQRESPTEHSIVNDLGDRVFNNNNLELLKATKKRGNPQRHREPKISLQADIEAVVSPEPYKRFLDSNPATKKSANVNLERKKTLFDESRSHGDSEKCYDKQIMAFERSVPSHEADLRDYTFGRERGSVTQHRRSIPQEDSSQENLMNEDQLCTADNEVDFKELYSLAQLQIKKIQNRLAQTESKFSSLQVEYDILNNSFDTASLQLERLQAENSELREKLSKIVSTNEHMPSTSENENVYRWRTLFQKAVSKLAEERQSRVKAENEKKRVLKELEVFEEDIMKRFVVLRNQAKARVKEMKAWTSQMEQIRELLEMLPPKTGNTAWPQVEKGNSSDKQQRDADMKANKHGKVCAADNTNSTEVESAKSTQAELNTLKKAEKELASEHEAEERLLEQWRVDAQRLTASLQHLLQPTQKLDRPEKLKRKESLNR